jgi:hypothetical protein
VSTIVAYSMAASPGSLRALRLRARRHDWRGDRIILRARPATISKRQTAAEHLDRIEHEFGIEAAFDVGGLPETVLLARE